MAIKKIAVVGAGISGLACAYELSKQSDLEITLFEAGAHLGGHSNTVDMELNTACGLIRFPVDTGFLVFNQRTYPRLIRLFDELKVPTAKSNMSFSASIQTQNGEIEWAGNNLNSFFGQRKNILNPYFWKMAKDIFRFNQITVKIANNHLSHLTAEEKTGATVGEFLNQYGFSQEFRDWYFLPMVGAIWSCPTEEMLHFPIATMIRFCYNHGLLEIQNRPQWYTVQGGSREYVARIVTALEKKRVSIVRQAVLNVKAQPNQSQGVKVVTQQQSELFDGVVMACHSDESLRLVEGNSQAEKQILASIRYQKNKAVLHTDESFLPRVKRCWAAWNYSSRPSPTKSTNDVSVNYLINVLQPLPTEIKNQAVVVSLNPQYDPDPSKVFARIDYAHPLFDSAAIRAQKRLPLLQGHSQIWYCGAWTAYGFHEDGLRSGELVAADLIASIHSPRNSPPIQSSLL
jgi:hypothetical protein